MENSGTIQARSKAQGETGGIDRMIKNAQCDAAMAFYAGVGIGRAKPELSEKIQGRVRILMPEFFEPKRPTETSDGESLDAELDVMPAMEWLRLLDGVELAGDTVEEQPDLQKTIEERVKNFDPSAISEKIRRDAEIVWDDSLTAIREKIGHYAKPFQKQLLTALMSDIEPTLDAADKLNVLEAKVREIYAGLDSKTKAVIVILRSLDMLDGLSVGVEFGNTIINEFGYDEEIVPQALKENPDDKDLAALAEAYKLACVIYNEDDRTEQLAKARYAQRQKTVAEPEQEPETEAENVQPEALAEQPADAPTEFFEQLTKDRAEIATRHQKKPNPIAPTERLLSEWLLKQNFKTKLACSIMGILRNGDHNGTDDLANELYSRFDDEIMAVAANPPASLPRDELLMTGVYSEMALWEERL